MRNGQDGQGGQDGSGRREDGEGRAAALRRRTLRRLTGLEPEEGEAARKALVARLARALRGERQRGKAGHWSYDLNRHIALSQAYRAECDGLRAARRTRPRDARDDAPSSASASQGRTSADGQGDAGRSPR